ncbi:hypothetical protein C1H46_028077 [Malus baccata]|uniref:Uncharacterized protein n=1 Tax=Malus baccata TaxID=106549 RepID=A0A540LIT0_MALBA|nr:hypothetical protein C1H46_028077 [Malus baccata]
MFRRQARCREFNCGMNLGSSARISSIEFGFCPTTLISACFQRRKRFRCRVSPSLSPWNGSKLWQCLLWLWLSVNANHVVMSVAIELLSLSNGWSRSFAGIVQLRNATKHQIIELDPKTDNPP